MNAHLALAIVQEEVAELQGKKDIWSLAYQDAVKSNLAAACYYRKELDAIENKLHPLLIVLESAKYLHEELIDQDLIKNEDSFRVLCLQTDLEEYKEITYDQARAIGLEEGEKNETTLHNRN